MASYAYGGLLVRVTGDTRPLTTGVAAEATKAGNDAGERISKSIGASLGKNAAKLGKSVATALGTGVLAVTAFGVASVKTAAQVQLMTGTMNALAKANGVTTKQATGTVAALRKQGIQVEAATSVVSDFIKGHLDLSKATKLSSVALDASVVSGKSAGDVLEAITKTIETGNTRQLRQAGLIINSKEAYKTYAEQLHTTVSNLTEAQRETAIMNAVLDKGKTIAGAYAASLNDPARALKAFPRIAHDIQVSLGTELLKAFGPLIVGAAKLGKELRTAVAPGGTLAPVFTAAGKAATTLVAPLTQVINLTTKWLGNLKPGSLNNAVGVLSKFAPVFASIGTALGAFAGGQFLTKLPVIGSMFAGLTGPIGAVVTGLATLALTSPDARKALGQIAATLASAVQPAMSSLVPVIGELGNALGQVLAAGLQAVVPLIPPLVTVLLAAVHVIIPLVPLITGLADALAYIAPVLVPVVAAWWAITTVTGLYTTALEANILAQAGQRLSTIAGTVTSAAQTVAIIALYTAQYVARAATIAWTAAQWLLNAALDANPIGIVIVALAALAAALIIAWQRSATFRGIVIGTWQAIWGVVLPILTAFGALISSVFGAASRVISAACRNWQTILRTTMTILLAVATGGLSLLATTFVRHWGDIVAGARSAGGSIINGLKSGITTAISGIGGWIKKSIVDPIVNNVKKFFGIHSPSTVMEGIGGYLMKGLFIGMVPGVSGIGDLIGTVFGGFPAALASLIGHGLIGIASLPGKALNAIMSLFGGGNSSALAATAKKWEGHRYVWGGGANPTTGFDCSSFVNMVAGGLGLGLPGGFRAPSARHGPTTLGWLGHGAMSRVAQSAMRINDLYVNDQHMGIVTGPGTGFAARSTATGTGPQPVGSGYDILRFPGGGLKLPGWLSGVMGKIGGLLGGLFGGGHGPAGGQPVPAGVSRWAPLMRQVLGMFGRVDLLPVFLAQIATESNGNQFAQNNWDSNARAGTPSKGLGQLIQPTFDAFAGPFRKLGIFNPMANLYAMAAYALKRYGKNIAAVLGHGHGYATGGVISEPVTGIGARSGSVYHIGERGPELVSPLTGPGAAGGMSGARCVINVYPSAGMDERALAAMVSRELAWATAGGTI